MMEREIRIPRLLRPIHGETSTLFDILLVSAVGVVFGVLVLLFASTRIEALPFWKAAILFLLAADMGGGAVSCFTAGKDAYYAKRPGLRWGFIHIHILQPALFSLLFDGRFAYWIFLYGFTMAAASLVNIIPGRTRQEGIAAGLVVIGIVILLPIGLSTPYLVWFGPVYMLKLILGFSVRRTEQG